MKNKISMNRYYIILFLLFLLRFPSTGQDLPSEFYYPHARTEKFDTTIFDIQISDPFFWMSKKENEEEMTAFSREQGLFTRQVLDSISGNELLEATFNNLFNSMEENNDLWGMQVINGSFYYLRNVSGKGTTLCKRNNLTGPEETILGEVRINGKKYAVRRRVFAYNQPLLALMLTEGGENNPHIRIFHLDKKEFLSDSIGPVMFNDSRGASIAWSTDGKSLFYSQSPQSTINKNKYYNGIINQHFVGTDFNNDVPVFGNNQHHTISLPQEETPYIYTFPNSPYIIIRIRSAWEDSYAFAVHQSDLSGRSTPWKRIKDCSNLGEGFDVRGNLLYAAMVGKSGYQLWVHDLTGTEPPKIVFAPVPDELAGSDGSHNKAIIAGRDVVYVLMRKIGDMYINRIDLTSGATHRIPASKGYSFDRLQLFNENDLVYCEISPVKTDTYHWYEYNTDQVHVLPFAKNTLDFSDQLKTEVVFVTSRDGVQIPVSLVYDKSTNINETNRWLIESYGFSGASRDLYFDPYVFPWTKFGGVYAYAHVRGEGGKGYQWYQDGQFPNKHNSINDLVDVADWLVSEKLALSSQIVIMGASGGSILVGNAINQRPDLFAGGVYMVGLPDLATYSDAASAREGNKSMGPKSTPEGFLSNYQHSALYHIPEGKELPAFLIIHGASDYILDMSPAARYTARLQKTQQGKRPRLLLVQWEGGHSTINENEPIDILKFALWQTGHPGFHPK